MRITSIKLRDFRCHNRFSTELDRYNFVVGANASGKSSIGLAIEFALTGKAAGVTDAGGRGAEDLILIGSKELEVRLEIDKDGALGKVMRRKSQRAHELSLNDRVLPVPEAQRRLYEALGVSGDVLSACLNSSRFVQMDEKAQKVLLAQVLACDPPEIPDAIREDIRSLDPYWDGTQLDVSGIDTLHKTFYALRTDTNRDLKNLGAVEEPAEESASYQDAKTLLDSLRKELSASEKSKTTVEERYRSVVESNKRTRTMIETRKTEAHSKLLSESAFASLEKRAADSEKARTMAIKIKVLESTLHGKRSKIDQENAAQVARLTQIVTEQRGSIEESESVFASLSAIKSQCPTCQRALKTAEKNEISGKLAEKLKEQRAALEQYEKELRLARESEYPEEINQLQVELDGQKRTLEAIGDIAEVERQLRAHREAIVESGRCDRDFKEIKDPLIPDVSAITSQIEELNKRIAQGEQVLEGLRDAERNREAYREYCERKADLEKRVATLERLIEFFGPNGIKTKMVGDKIGPFAKSMNNTLLEFGYSIDFQMEPYTLRIEHGKTQRTIRQLSESEQFRFGIAFQIALARTTGLNFVLIDRADILLRENRNILASRLMDSGLDQAIVLLSSDGEIPDTFPEGVKFIELREAVTA